MADTQSPFVKNPDFTSIKTTYDSITVTWEKATDNVTPADQIEYTVYIKEDSDTGNSTPVYTGKNLTSYTFKGLKEDTEYNVHVVAKDKAGYFVQYPAQCAVMRIRTKVYDVEPPTVANTHFKTIETTHDSITVTWEKAIDNISSADKIKYHVYIKESSDPGEPTLAEAKPNLTSYTFRGLKADTEYLVHVKARDEADNFVRYPAKNASMRIRTKVYDPVAPQAKDTQFRTILTTTNSITVTWEKATDNVTAADKIKYTVYIGEDKPKEKLMPVHTAKNLETYTFNGLKPYTEYLVKVVAEDEAGNYIQYPAKNASMRIKTNPADKEAPKVTSRAFKVSDLLDDRFTIQWEKATDNNTPTSSIRYEVGVTETGNPRDPWRIETKQGISSYTFTGLKPNTAYACFVQAYDYAGNLLRYPSDNANQIVRTSAKRVHSISFTVEQKATVLPGTNSISFGIEYNYYQVDAQGNIIGHGSGAWEAKWSNKSTKRDTITLPANCYFERNEVFIRIRSRKAASAGLNKWTACSSGYVDVSSGVLKFRLVGNYFYYTVRLGGTAEEGYSLFK